MKIRIINGLLIVDLLTFLLVAAIVFAPSDLARIILGLPFLMFFPGYTVAMAIFVHKRNMDSLELTAISLGISVAVVALIGFGLNFTHWGIRLEPVLYSVAAFILIMSAVALIRRAAIGRAGRLTQEIYLKWPGWEKGVYNQSLFLVLIVLVLGASALLGYNIVATDRGESFTEFYVLGLNGKAQDYPTEIILDGGQVSGVRYGAANDINISERAKVTLGIVNHELQNKEYFLRVTIDSEPLAFNYQGKNINQLGPLVLQPGEKWEQEIGLAAQNPGNDQKVEFWLFKNDINTVEHSLNLWINVRN